MPAMSIALVLLPAKPAQGSASGRTLHLADLYPPAPNLSGLPACRKAVRICGMISLSLTACKFVRVDQSGATTQAFLNLRLVEEDECSPMLPTIRGFCAW